MRARFLNPGLLTSSLGLCRRAAGVTTHGHDARAEAARRATIAMAREALDALEPEAVLDAVARAIVTRTDLPAEKLHQVSNRFARHADAIEREQG